MLNNKASFINLVGLKYCVISIGHWLFNHKKLIILVMIFALSICSTLEAQPPPPGPGRGNGPPIGPPGNGNGGPKCWPPPCIPIDNGIQYLMIAGLLYGARKSYQLSQDKKAKSSTF